MRGFRIAALLLAAGVAVAIAAQSASAAGDAKAGRQKAVKCLACHGLDVHDNDFVIGLIGKELFPLSAVVQAMRKTQQTSHHMQEMGPFFVGKAVWQKVL